MLDKSESGQLKRPTYWKGGVEHLQTLTGNKTIITRKLDPNSLQ